MIIDRPRGLVPRAQGCGLGPEYAEVAENIRLSERGFQPWRQPLQLVDFDERICTAHVRDCCWTGTAVPDARYVDAGMPVKTYLSAPGQRPVVTDSLCESDWRFLGYPVPDPAVAISDMGPDKSADTELRTYRITYGTDCEEGPASCPSNAIYADKTTRVRLQLPTPPDEMWGATHVNIYRLVSLWDVEQGLQVSMGSRASRSAGLNEGWNSSATESEYFRVGRVAIRDCYFIDDESIETDGLLVTEDLFPPGDGTQIVGETESGSLVGFNECNLFFSERNQFWGFPLKAVHSFPDPIVDVVVCRDSVYILTCDQQYLVQDSVDCSDSSERPVVLVKGAPPATCDSRGHVVFDACVYSSPEGLIALRADGSYSNLTSRSFGKDEWSALGPNPIRVGTGHDHLFVSVQEGPTYVWLLSLDESGSLQEDVATLSFTPDHWIEADGELYFLVNNRSFQFHVGDYMSFMWRQVEQRFARREILSAIDGEYVKKNSLDFNCVTVYKGGSKSATRELRGRTRIPGSRSDCTQIEVTGNQPMCWVGYGAGFNDIERREQ